MAKCDKYAWLLYFALSSVDNSNRGSIGDDDYNGGVEAGGRVGMLVVVVLNKHAKCYVSTSLDR